MTNHVFQIIYECNDLLLNNYERYYQDYYINLGFTLLNLKLTHTDDKSGKLSEETKQKIGLCSKINCNTPEAKKRTGDINRGKNLSETIKNKISMSVKNIYYPKKYKSIIQTDLQDNFIKEWPSLKDAAQYYNILANSIGNCLTGRSKTCNNFKWKYKK